MKAEVNGYSIEIPDPPVVEGWEHEAYRLVEYGDCICVTGHIEMYRLDIPQFCAWIMRRVRKTRRVVRFVECADPVCSDDGMVWFMRHNGSFACGEWGMFAHDWSRWLRREDSVEEMVE